MSELWSLNSDWLWYWDFCLPYISYQKLLCLFLVWTSLRLSGILLLVRRGSELFGVSAQTDSGIRISALLIYPTRSYWAYFWCEHLWDFQVFVLIVRRGSEFFGVSGQTDSGIRILAFLIYPTRSYCGYFYCAPLWVLSGISTVC